MAWGRQVLSGRERAGRETVWSEVRRAVMRLFLFLLSVELLFSYVIALIPAPTRDMEPRIAFGDLVLVFRLDRDIHPQDVVCFLVDGQRYLGRVIAGPGDIVEVADGRVKLNGKALLEPNIAGATPAYEEGIGYPLEVGEDEFFILCDRREGGADSRVWGSVSRAEIEGLVVTVIRRNNL